jgi:hypothetical protein
MKCVLFSVGEETIIQCTEKARAMRSPVQQQETALVAEKFHEIFQV